MSRFTDALEAIVRRVVREELEGLVHPHVSVRVKCARKGCTNQTQTGSPFCSPCRQGHKPNWKHPRLRVKRPRKCRTEGCTTLTGSHEFCSECRKAIRARAA